MKLGIRAGPLELASIKDIVAWLETSHLRADGDDGAGGVPTENLPGTGLRGATAPDLGIHGIDRDRPNLDQQVAAFGLGLRQIDIYQGGVVLDRLGLLIADGTHVGLLLEWETSDPYFETAQERTNSIHSIEKDTEMPRPRYSRKDCTPGCVVEAALSLIDGKWKGVLLYHLFQEGTLRFGELRRKVPGCTQRIMTAQLRELEADGLVARKVYP